jgi:hypothetical protein
VGMLPFILFTWLIHAVVGGVLSLPLVYWSRNTVRWHRWEALAFLVPFTVWTLLTVSDLSAGKKTLSNLLLEPAVLGACLAVGALVRIAAGDATSGRLAPRLTLAGLCLLAAGVFWILPALPE